MRALLGAFLVGKGETAGAVNPPTIHSSNGQTRAALDDIVGVWQSDTVNGASAHSGFYNNQRSQSSELPSHVRTRGNGMPPSCRE